MRWWSVFLFAGRQRLRDRLGLALTLLTAPLFVVFYWLFFSEASTGHVLAVLDEDRGAHAAALIEALGAPPLEVRPVGARRPLRRALIRGEADLGLVIPPGFTSALSSKGETPAVTLVGNAASAGFGAAAALARQAVTGYAGGVLRHAPPVVVREEPLGRSAARTPFEAYVPGLLVFAVIMLIFSSSMSVVRELESGTLSRLRLTPVSSAELLSGLSLVQLLLGAASVLLTLATARLLGFRSEGSLLLAMAVAALACLASVGIGMFVASVSRTQTRAFLVGSMAMFLLVLFSGIVFPQPAVTLFTAAGRSVDLFDLLPTTHMSAALSKVMILGAGIREVRYELAMLAAVAAVNFLLGALFLARIGRPSADVWEGLV
jgi:ABC-2 type transport system permease protein